MYQYSRAIYRSIKDLIDPYVDHETQLEYRRAVLTACEQTMDRLAKDPDNRLLWRMNRRRLEGEILWDAMHASAGTLNTP